MKKFLIALALGFTISANAGTFTLSQSVLAGTMTNIYVGPCKLTQIIVNSTNNATGILVDSSTNTGIVYTTAPFTNTVSYLTNAYNLATNGTYSQFFYTNYYGVLTYLTNWNNPGASTYGPGPLVQVDVTNSVPATTNTLPLMYVSCTTVPSIITAPSQYMFRGISFTNTSPNAGTVTITVTGITQ